jgi:hypothetical protein
MEIENKYEKVLFNFLKKLRVNDGEKYNICFDDGRKFCVSKEEFKTLCVKYCDALNHEGLENIIIKQSPLGGTDYCFLSFFFKGTRQDLRSICCRISEKLCKLFVIEEEDVSEIKSEIIEIKQDFSFIITWWIDERKIFVPRKSIDVIISRVKKALPYIFSDSGIILDYSGCSNLLFSPNSDKQYVMNKTILKKTSQEVLRYNILFPYECSIDDCELNTKDGIDFQAILEEIEKEEIGIKAKKEKELLLNSEVEKVEKEEEKEIETIDEEFEDIIDTKPNIKQIKEPKKVKMIKEKDNKGSIKVVEKKEKTLPKQKVKKEKMEKETKQNVKVVKTKVKETIKPVKKKEELIQVVKKKPKKEKEELIEVVKKKPKKEEKQPTKVIKDNKINKEKLNEEESQVTDHSVNQNKQFYLKLSKLQKYEDDSVIIDKVFENIDVEEIYDDLVAYIKKKSKLYDKKIFESKIKIFLLTLKKDKFGKWIIPNFEKYIFKDTYGDSYITVDSLYKFFIDWCKINYIEGLKISKNIFSRCVLPFSSERITSDETILFDDTLIIISKGDNVRSIKILNINPKK